MREGTELRKRALEHETARFEFEKEQAAEARQIQAEQERRERERHEKDMALKDSQLIASENDVLDRIMRSLRELKDDNSALAQRMRERLEKQAEDILNN